MGPRIGRLAGCRPPESGDDRASSGLRLRQLLAELRGRVAATVPRATLVFLTPAVAIEPPPEPTPWDTDYWLRRFPDHEQA